jgi:AraC-like DNA-binding protein
VSLTDTVVHRDDSLVTLDVRCTCAAGEHDEEETPPGFEVVLPLAGALVRRAGAMTSLVDAAWGYLAQPSTAHEIVHVSDGDRCVALAPTQVLADELGLDARAASASWVVPVDRSCHRRLSRAFATTARRDELASGEAWLSVLSGLAAAPRSERSSRAAQHEAAVARVREAIVTAPGAAWTVRSLGSVAGYAPHHLSRVFRSTTGMTLSAYRDRVRLGRAMALLQEGMPVADVAADLGYVDHAHLTRRATQLLGMPPSAFRSPDRAPMSKRSP